VNTSAGWKRFFHVTDGIVIPVIIAGAFSLLMLEGRPTGLAFLLFCVATSVMIGLWNLMRELRAHATATRAAAIGEPDELIALAQGEIKRRLTTRSRAPFWIYLGLGHQLRGDLDAAADAFTQAERYAPLKPAWRMLANTARIGLLVERGDAAAARALYDGTIVPAAQRMTGPGVRLLTAEAEARVKFAEGDHAGARAMFERMCKDVRLGPSTRALAHWYAARCAEALGDDAAATQHFADAAKLVPKTYLARRPAGSSTAASKS
jgi:tetratricopeptide (TPR) repeat protein